MVPTTPTPFLAALAHCCSSSDSCRGATRRSRGTEGTRRARVGGRDWPRPAGSPEVPLAMQTVLGQPGLPTAPTAPPRRRRWVICTAVPRPATPAPTAPHSSAATPPMPKAPLKSQGAFARLKPNLGARL